MRTRAFIGVIALSAAMFIHAPASAEPCCDDVNTVCCEHRAPCCDDDSAAAAALLPVPGQDKPRPTRETMLVTFRDPVRVGHFILMGKYVIEHDTVRMAKGRPCTYIYRLGAALPTVAFRCVHLRRPYSPRPKVTLRPSRDGSGLRVLTEFQLQGEAAAHGVPGLTR